MLRLFRDRTWICLFFTGTKGIGWLTLIWSTIWVVSGDLNLRGEMHETIRISIRKMHINNGSWKKIIPEPDVNETRLTCIRLRREYFPIRERVLQGEKKNRKIATSCDSDWNHFMHYTALLHCTANYLILHIAYFWKILKLLDQFWAYQGAVTSWVSLTHNKC